MLRMWNNFDFWITILSTVDWLNDVMQSWGLRSMQCCRWRLASLCVLLIFSCCDRTISLTTLRILRIARLAKFLRGAIFKAAPVHQQHEQTTSVKPCWSTVFSKRLWWSGLERIDLRISLRLKSTILDSLPHDGGELWLGPLHALIGILAAWL
eukprot:4564655-Amphidinium_carterae.2